MAIYNHMIKLIERITEQYGLKINDECYREFQKTIYDLSDGYSALISDEYILDCRLDLLGNFDFQITIRTNAGIEFDNFSLPSKTMRCLSEVKDFKIESHDDSETLILIYPSVWEIA